MFTGIVEEVGVVHAVDREGASATLTVGCRALLPDARVGESLSVNGCCVTVTGVDCERFHTHLMGETLARTALGDLHAGDPVNLERALRADGRLGGHLVQGHVDGVGRVVQVSPEQGWTRMTLSLPAPLRRYVVEKGSITVDGTSLTVAGTGDGSFSVGLIPHTLEATTLGRRRPGDRVNLEVDVIAKYVERMLAEREA